MIGDIHRSILHVDIFLQIADDVSVVAECTEKLPQCDISQTGDMPSM